MIANRKCEPDEKLWHYGKFIGIKNVNVNLFQESLSVICKHKLTKNYQHGDEKVLCNKNLITIIDCASVRLFFLEKKILISAINFRKLKCKLR